MYDGGDDTQVAHGARVSALGDRAWLPLHFAAKMNMTDVLPILSGDASCLVNVKTADGASALYLAYKHGCSSACSLLLELGATPVAVGER